MWSIIEINIFNRWGEEVYYSNDPDEVWMGNVKGGDYYAPTGCTITACAGKGHVPMQKSCPGTIELMR